MSSHLCLDVFALPVCLHFELELKLLNFWKPDCSVFGVPAHTFPPMATECELIGKQDGWIEHAVAQTRACRVHPFFYRHCCKASSSVSLEKKIKLLLTLTVKSERELLLYALGCCLLTRHTCVIWIKAKEMNKNMTLYMIYV